MDKSALIVPLDPWQRTRRRGRASSTSSVPQGGGDAPPPSRPSQAADGEDGGWSKIQAKRPWALLARVLTAMTAVLVGAWAVGEHALQPTRSDLDAVAAAAPRRPQSFRPSHPTSAALLSQIDFDKVHRELLPAWVIAMQHDPYTLGRNEADRTFNALRAEAGKDPNLAALLDELFEKMMEDVAVWHADLAELWRGWNLYMARNGLAWRVEHHIERHAKGSLLFARSYHVLSDMQVTTAGEPYRALLLARADRTNLVEAFFGQTSIEHDGALIISDRIVEFVTAQVLPMFAREPALQRNDLQRAFASHVRREAVQSLSAETVEALQDGATRRDRLLAATREIGQRKGCGRTVVIEEVPWTGLTDRALGKVQRAAEKNARKNCRRLTRSDADFLAQESRSLASDEALEHAIGRAGAWLARAVVVHEVRHLADDRHAEQGGRTPACALCPETLGGSERAEVRAYLASFGTEGMGYLALMQACGTGAHGQGPTGAALGWVLGKLLPSGCEGPLPEDLYARARAMESLLFGSSDAFDLPAAFPSELPVPR